MAGLLILSLETATGCGSVALTEGSFAEGKVLAEYTVQPDVKHSRRLLGMIASMMDAVALPWSALDGVAVSMGPGSFTGLRIGMAAGKGIAMAAAVPLLGVPTLDALALHCPPMDRQLCCVLDARKQQVYAALYRHEYRDRVLGWHRTSEYWAVSPEELARRLQEPTLAIGPGLAVCQPWLATNPLVRLAPAAPLHPRAALVGFLGASSLAKPEFKQSSDPAPLYIRPAEAEMHGQPVLNTTMS